MKFRALSIIILLASTVAALAGFAPMFMWGGTPSTTTTTAIGANLAKADVFTSEMPFLNIAKLGGGWFASTSTAGGDTLEEAYLYSNIVDANHYPMTLSGPTGSFAANATASTSIVSGTYNSVSGLVTLTLSATINLDPGFTVVVSGVTGAGTAAVNGTFSTAGGTGGTTLTYNIATLLSITITPSTGTASSTMISITGSLSGAVGTPWIGGTLAGTGISGTPVITQCPSGGCGITGHYAVSSAQTFSTTTITESQTSVAYIAGFLQAGEYQAGTYVFTCGTSAAGGTNTILLTGATTQTINCPSRNVFTISSPAKLEIVESALGGATHYINSFSLVYSPGSTAGTCPSACGVNETALLNGETLDPLFVANLKQYNRSCRSVDWLVANDNPVIDWSQRSLPAWAFWNEGSGGAGPNGDGGGGVQDIGVPLEIFINAVNEGNCGSLWITMPGIANDNYVINAAALVHTKLNSSINVVLEWCNEVWLHNYDFALYNPASTIAATLFPVGFSIVQNLTLYMTMRNVQNQFIWKNVWGADASRLRRDIGGWFNNGNSFSQYVLSMIPTQDSGLTGTGTGTITGGNLLTVSGASASNIIGQYSRLSGAGITNNICAVSSFGTGSGGNGTYNLTGTCPNVGPETMTFALWGTGPVVTANVVVSGSGLTCSLSCPGVAIGQYVASDVETNIPFNTKVVSGSGSSWTLSQNGSYTGVAHFHAASDLVAANEDALATAPYFFNTIPLAISADGDGGKTRLFGQINSGTLLPVAAGRPTTGGTSTAYTLTTGQGLSGTPTNGKCVAAQFHTDNGNSPAIVVDSVASLPIFDYGGGTLTTGNDINSNGGLANVICFTNATSAGSVTAGWRLNAGAFGPSGGEIAGTTAGWAVDLAIAQSFGIALDGYEWGAEFTGAPLNTLYAAANADARMGTAYTSALTQLKAENPGTIINHYNDIALFGAANTSWGLIQFPTQACSASPKCAAVNAFTTR